jgi:hypothetical protein
MIVIAVHGLICTGCAPSPTDSASAGSLLPDNTKCRITGGPQNTLPDADRRGKISIEGLLIDLPVDPRRVKTLRRDIFNKGYFSVFDCLVHVCKEHDIELRYHFDKKLRTHVIDAVGNKKNWWYAAVYHGGGVREEPIHRMDTHPYKDWMKMEIYQVSAERIEQIYSAFRAEAKRLKANKDKIIIPEVLIQTPNQELTFRDVEVRPHRIRSDMFRSGVVTAADVMLSAAGQDKLSLGMVWREQFGTALVQGYYFVQLNQDQAHGRSGFTYSLGEKINHGRKPPGKKTGNNYFHMTTDIRVIASPEYMRWKWTGPAPPKTPKQAQPRQ